MHIKISSSVSWKSTFTLGDQVSFYPWQVPCYTLRDFVPSSLGCYIERPASCSLGSDWTPPTRFLGTILIFPCVICLQHIKQYINNNLFIFSLFEGIDHHQTILRLLYKCITPLYSSYFINTIWPEFTKLLATRQITIHEFHWTDWTDWV